MSMSKEKPILMNSESVRAILGGRKTQTRRVIKPQPEILSAPMGAKTIWWKGRDGWLPASIREYCPYGKVGDRLWVKETFKIIDSFVWYKADGMYIKKRKWKPSIFMPHWASRITLEVVDIRVERVQDISREDVIAEGCEGMQGEPREKSLPVHQVVFADLWDSINAKRGYGWDMNPFVWVIVFKQI